MKKFLMVIVLLIVCLSGCISITNAPVTTPATPAVSAPIRTSDVQTPVQTPTVVTTSPATIPCATCGGYYQYPQYQYPCTTCQQQTPTVIYQPSTPIYQYPAKPTTVLPAGWEWYWDGSQWISRQIPGYVIPISVPVTPVISSQPITNIGFPDSSQWRAQTFTVGSDVTLTQISIMLEKFHNPGNLICDLMNVDVNGHPTGTVLSSYTMLASNVSGRGSYVFYLSSFLSAGRQYALVFHLSGGSLKNFYQIYGTKTNSYGGGCVELSNNGRNWRSYSDLDATFSIN